MMRGAIPVFAWLVVAAAPAPDSDDARAMAGHEAWITRQVSPGGQACCSMADGRPADVRRINGHYEVLYSPEHWEGGTGEWLPVRDDAVLPMPSPILMPIAWIAYGRVLCLALPAAS